MLHKTYSLREIKSVIHLYLLQNFQIFWVQFMLNLYKNIQEEILKVMYETLYVLRKIKTICFINISFSVK